MKDEETAGKPAEGKHPDSAGDDLSALHEQIEQLSALVAVAEPLVVIQDGRFVFQNRAFIDMSTYSPDELEAVDFAHYVHPEDRAAMMEAYQCAMAGGELPSSFEFRTVIPNGGIRRYRLRPRAGRWHGRPAILSPVAELRPNPAGELKCEPMLDTVSAGVCEIEVDSGRFLRVNDRLCEMLGYTRGELMSMQPFAIVAPEYRDAAGERRGRALRGLPFAQPVEYRLIGNHGIELWAQITSRVIHHDDGTLSTIEIMQDISEDKRREAETRRVEKLESLGVLAGGIAHDFNNLLTAILGNATIGRRRAGDAGRVALVFDEIEQACTRAANLTQQLLTFSRGGAPIKRITSIADTLSECASLALRGSHARCAFEISEGLWSVDVDEGQIGQVITNLALNADQAMPEGGVVTLVAGNLELAKDSPLPLAAGRYVHIEVVDRGVGISPDHLSSIFDPYFTTKQDGRGLGLATAHSIMQRHGGHITVDSEPGAGTTVHLYLPASEDEAPAAPPRRPKTSHRGSGRILLMDDEDVVRDLGERLLQTLGYQATAVADGDQAIATFAAAREAGAGFDGVILDLTVSGGRGGKSTLDELRRLDPELRALVMSGYYNDPVLADPTAYGFRLALTKPFTLDQMGTALRELLDDGSTE